MINTECYVDVRSYGCNDGAFKGGHIRVNWTMVQSISTSGIFLVIVDPVTCTGRPFPVVNVAGGGTAAANVLINYLNIVTKGQVCFQRYSIYIFIAGIKARKAKIPAKPAPSCKRIFQYGSTGQLTCQ